MARNKRGRAFELDGVRYMGSPPRQAALRVKFVDMREIGSGPLGEAEPSREEVIAPAPAVEERKGRRASLPVFDPSAPVAAPEPEGEGGQE